MESGTESIINLDFAEIKGFLPGSGCYKHLISGHLRQSINLVSTQSGTRRSLCIKFV